MKINEIKWICGSVNMPFDFEKTYILKYVKKQNYTDGTQVNSFSTICKLTKIDEIGFHFKTHGDVCRPSGDYSSKTVVRIYDNPENTSTIIGHIDLINIYWSEISLDNSDNERLNEFLLEKKKLESRLKELETLIEEEDVDSNMVELDESYFHDIDKDLREKFDTMLIEAKEEYKDNPNWIFKEYSEYLTV